MTSQQRADVHKKFYDELQAKIDILEEKFIVKGLKKLRQRDLARYQKYEICLEDEGKDPVEVLKVCTGELNDVKEMKEIKDLEVLKGKLYECVNHDYMGKPMGLLKKDGFGSCLDQFEAGVESLF